MGVNVTSTRKRLNPEDSRRAALTAARALLIESGPQAVTLKAVAGRIGRTHSNLLHHFGSAAGLQRELAGFLAETVCETIEHAFDAQRAGIDSIREVVDLTFDAFDQEGAGTLASWMMLTGHEDALDPILEAIHALVERITSGDEAGSSQIIRQNTMTLVLMALGDSMLGTSLAETLRLPRESARDIAESHLRDAWAKASAEAED